MKKLYLLLILVFLLIGFFPFLASTPIGKPLFIRLLEERLKGQIQIEKIHLSWLGPQRFENATFVNDATHASAQLFTSDAPFWKLSRLENSFTLQNAVFTFPSYPNVKITQIEIEKEGSSLKAKGSTPQGGSLSIQGKLLSKQDFDISAQLHQIPTIAIDSLLSLHNLAYKALGETFNAQGICSFKQNEGTVSVELSSPYCTGALYGNIANNILTLNRPLTLSLQMHQALEEEIVKHINPDILTGFKAKNPFILTIDPQGFRCPTSPFQLKALQIQAATLDLGQVAIQSGDLLQSLLKLFKDKNLQTLTDVWFTPIKFDIQNEILQLGRLDALLSRSIHLCLWGDVSLQKNKLDLFLGIPEDTLKESFGVQTISRNYVLKIPIRGSLNNPKFDTGPAIAKIATMAASRQIPTKAGQIFGGIVNAVTQGQDDGDAPPPNRPFPWEK